MRTTIFNQFANLPKEFREDFDVLWQLPKQARAALLPHISQIERAETKGQEKALLDKAVTEIGGDPGHLLRSLKLLSFISQSWNPTRDTPENFLKDIAELQLIPAENIEDAKPFLLELLSELERDNLRRLEKIHASSLLPSFIGASTLVDFRAVFREPFGSGLDDKIDGYEPKCLGVVPVILVKIKRDSEDPREFSFQTDEHGIRMFLDELQAALKNLQSARAAVNLGGKPS